MNELKIKKTIFGRKVRMIFNLAALKIATRVTMLDLGDFFTSKKITNDVRKFYHSYGAYIAATEKEHTDKRLKKFSNWYKKLTYTDLQKIDNAIAASNIISDNLKKSIQDISKKKTTKV